MRLACGAAFAPAAAPPGRSKFWKSRMREEYDVVVIGAGPGGSVAARELARAGLSVLLLEKRERVGYPVRCGEASTTFSDLQSFGPIPEECIEGLIDGLFVYGPAGTEIDYYRGNVGVMLDREKFDPCLANLAAEDGAELMTLTRASNVSAVKDGFRFVSVVLPNGGEALVRARMVVGADGVESLVGRMVGINSLQEPATTCCGVDIKIEGILTRPDYLTFWQGHDWINDGYIWSFPKVRSNVTNFGAGFLIPKHKEASILEVTLGWLGKLFPGAKIISTVGGVIPVSGNLKSYTLDSLALVGDAAHHTNPLTGGGISAAMKAGRHAAKVIAEGFKAGDLSQAFLKRYEELVWKDFGKAHRNQFKFRRFLLGQTRSAQIDTYKVLDSALGKGSKLDLILHPRRTAKVISSYLRFK